MLLTREADSPSPKRGSLLSRNRSSIVNRRPYSLTNTDAVIVELLHANNQGSFMFRAFTQTTAGTRAMLAYLIRRLWQMVPTLLGVILLVFVLFKLFGGDPAEILGGLNATAEQVESIRQQLGLNEPWWVQLGIFVKQIFSFDWGKSWATNESVANLFATRLPATLTVMIPILILDVLVALPIAAALWTWTGDAGFLAAIAALFAVVTVAIGRWQGLRALIGLVLSALMIGGFVLPQILAGRDPVLVSIVGTAVLASAAASTSSAAPSGNSMLTKGLGTSWANRKACSNSHSDTNPFSGGKPAIASTPTRVSQATQGMRWIRPPRRPRLRSPVARALSRVRTGPESPWKDPAAPRSEFPPG